MPNCQTRCFYSRVFFENSTFNLYLAF